MERPHSVLICSGCCTGPLQASVTSKSVSDRKMPATGTAAPHTEVDSQGSGLGVGSSGLAQFVDELVLAGWLLCHLFACNLTVPGDA